MENNKIVFILPSKNSGGTHVVVKLFNAINKIEHSSSLHRVNKSIFGLFGELFKLFIYFIMSHFRKKEAIFIITEPLQCVIAAISGVSYMRYIQAEDLSLFKDRAFLMGKVITFIQRGVTLRDRNFLYVSDYVKAKYIHQKKGRGRVFLSFKVRPTLDSNFISRLEDEIKDISSQDNKYYTIGYMARTSPSKGLDEFCSWMSSMSSQLREKVDRILIISNEVSYSEITAKLDFDFDVVCPKNYNDVAVALRMVDVFIFNSKSEGFGLPPLEALLTGAQVVSSKCGGIDEYLNDGNSFLFNISDRNDFMQALAKPIVQNVMLNVDRSLLAAKFSNYDDEFLNNLIGFIKDAP